MIIRIIVSVMLSFLCTFYSFILLKTEPEINEFSISLFSILSLSLWTLIEKINDIWTLKYEIFMERINIQQVVLNDFLNNYIAPIVEEEDKDKIVVVIRANFNKETIIVLSSYNFDSYIPLRNTNKESIKIAISQLQDDEWHLKANSALKQWNNQEGNF